MLRHIRLTATATALLFSHRHGLDRVDLVRYRRGQVLRVRVADRTDEAVVFELPRGRFLELNNDLWRPLKAFSLRLVK